MQRIQQVKEQLVIPNETSMAPVPAFRSKNKLEWFKEAGWGYLDTKLQLDSNGQAQITGDRYIYSGKTLPKAREWMEKTVTFNFDSVSPAQKEMQVAEPVMNQEFLDELKQNVHEISFDKKVRALHSRGHSLQEIWALRHGKLERCVDVVIFINSHDQAEKLVKLAIKHNVALIPFGGGTNVTQALMLEESEKRMIASVDVTRMNHVKWVDRKNMTACVEAGIIGVDMEKELSKYGVTCGHEPDSVEFSSLGGWISTRASGMKKNTYGNIDDIVITVKIVTPVGTFTKSADYPRISSGPDLNQFVLGSEGNFGIITEAVIKVKELPACVKYGSIVFKNFELGNKFMYDVARSGVWPASLRLMDNTQFQFGMALKPENHDKKKEYLDKLKKYYLFEVKKFTLEEICGATVMFIGDNSTVSAQEKLVYGIASKYGAIKGGAENGMSGYFMTFMIGYIRDFSMDYSFFGESFETSVSWSNVTTLCKNTEKRLRDECRQRGVKGKPLIAFRVTQIYDSGAAVYIYFGFDYTGIKNPLHVYEEIEDAARDEIMACGGSISHHHGVGKLRKKFMKNTVGDTGLTILRGLKQQIDPQNIFAANNFL